MKHSKITKSQIKEELKKKGYKLPHGYDIVKRKRKPKKKK